MDVQKRGLVPYNDKRIICADLPDGQPNPDTHAFRHYLLETVRMPEFVKPPAYEKMVVAVHRVKIAVCGSTGTKARDSFKIACALRADTGDDGDFDN